MRKSVNGRSAQSVNANGRAAQHAGIRRRALTRATSGAIEALEPRRLLAATLVKDIQDFSGYSNPSEITDVGGRVFFRATETYTGTELWSSDGTFGGTTLAKEINPLGSSNPSLLTAVNGKLFFFATNGTDGYELWTSDGTSAGTQMVKDLNPGSGGLFGNAAPPESWKNKVAVIGNTFFFVATGGGVYRSDGTSSGTTLVDSSVYASTSDQIVAMGTSVYFKGTIDGSTYGLFRANASGGNAIAVTTPGAITPYMSDSAAAVVGSRLFFAANNSNGKAIYVTNGTSAGTSMAVDLSSGSGSAFASNFSAFNGKLYFSNPADHQYIWQSDGTPATTSKVADVVLAYGPQVVGTRLVFLTDFRQMYSMTASTAPVAIQSFSGATLPGPILNGSIYFVAAAAFSTDYELWMTDGTAAGTMRAVDVLPGTATSNITYLTASGSRLYFAAIASSAGNELWASDGTAAGTSLVRDINVQTGDSSPANLVKVGSNVFFTAFNAATGTELWKTDGTTVGTMLVKDIYAGTSSSSPTSLTAVGSTLYFVADDGSHGAELWRSDGTAAGTVLVSDLVVGSGSSSPSKLTSVGGNKLYFRTETGNFPLLRNDVGSSTITTIAASADPQEIIELNGACYYTSGNALNKADPTTNATSVIVPANFGGAFGGIAPYEMTVVGTTLYFSGYYSPSQTNKGFELFKTNGTTAGTALVKDIIPTSSASGPQNFVALNSSTLLFYTYDGSKNSIWKSDGTAAGTVAISGSASLDLSSLGGGPNSWVINGASAYFAAGTSATGFELWKSDGTAGGTSMVKEIITGSASPFDSLSFGTVNGKTFFAANDGLVGNELWRSDGTAAGTVRDSDIYVSPGNSQTFSHSNPASFVTLGNVLLFRAASYLQGAELYAWQVDTTAPTASFAIVSPNPRTTPLPSIVVTFSEPVTGFDLADLSLTRDGTPVSLSGSTLTAIDSLNYSVSGLTTATTPIGNYTLTLSAAGAGIADLSANAMTASASRAFIVTEQIAPTAAADLHTTSASAGPFTHQFTVTYSDATGINIATIQGDEIQVTNATGFSALASLVSINSSTNGSPRIATYSIALPSGPPGQSYVVSILPNQVADTAPVPNYVVAGTLGSITFADVTPPGIGDSVTSNVSIYGGAFQTFTLNAFDSFGILLSTLDNADVFVTGPNGYAQYATFASQSPRFANSGTTDVIVTYRVAAPGGSWDGADVGTYSLTLKANAIRDTSNNSAPASDMAIGSFSVPDLELPRAIATVVPPIVPLSTAAYTFTVRHTDNVLLNASTIGAGDVRITGPNGFNVVATFVSMNPTTNAAIIDAVYSFAPPGGSWNDADNGIYNFQLTTDATADTSGNKSTAAFIGFATVNIDTTGPIGAATTTAVSQSFSASTYTFDVTWSDASTINASTFGDDDVQVTGPSGYTQSAHLLSVDQPGNGATRIATYSIPLPAGGWTTSTQGDYLVKSLANGVSDTVSYGPNGSIAATIGTFRVDVAGPSIAISPVSNVTARGGTSFDVTATYTDNTAVLIASISPNEVFIMYPTYSYYNGHFVQAPAYLFGNIISTTPNADSGTVTCVFRFTPPGGYWNNPDNGVYSIFSRGTVRDTLNNAASQSGSASFTVSVQPSLNDSFSGSSGGWGSHIDAPAGPITFDREVVVSGSFASVADLNVSFDITHKTDSDVKLQLISPSGTIVTLLDGVGGAGHNFTGTTLDDEAAGSINAGSAPFSGSFKPAQALSAFDGSPADGTWILRITDYHSADAAAALNAWSLSLSFANTLGPIAAVSSTSPIANGDAFANFSVTYLDDVAVDASSIDSNDIRITGPGGFDQLASLVSIDPAVGGIQRANYRIAGPASGTWDWLHSGQYTITLVANQVRDSAGNAAISGGANIGTLSAMIAPPSTINIASGITLTPTFLYLPASTRLTKTGPGTLALSANQAFEPNAQIEVAVGSLRFNGPAPANGSAANLRVHVDAGANALFNSGARLGSLALVGGSASVTTNGSALLYLAGLSITGGGRLDLNDNDLIVRNASRNTIAALIASAYDYGNWDGPGITSSSALNNPAGNTALGLLSGDEYSNNNGAPTFDGESISAGDVLIKYTYYGDVDFNGAVDSTDYNLIDFGYLTTASGWANGDVDYSGAIDSTDYNLIDFAFVSQSTIL